MTNLFSVNLPRIRNVGGVAHATPIGLQVILRWGKVPAARKRGRHWSDWMTKHKLE